MAEKVLLLEGILLLLIGNTNVEYKDYRIISDGTFGMYHIKQLGSGAVPSELSGAYTSPSSAKVAIDAYKPKRGVKKDAEAKATTDL